MRQHANPQTVHTILSRSALLLALATMLLVPASLRAADPAFVGILAIATDDAVAQRLGLSDEVKDQLRQLVQKRENAAIDLALSIKDLPPEERERRLAPFVKESERLGMELLTLQQRSQLHQLRLQRIGMTSLAEPDMAQVLKLTQPQQAEIGRLLSQRSVALTRGGEQSRRMARGTFERQLWMVLTDAQKATWDQLAGRGPGPSAANKTAESTAQPAAADKPAMAADSSQPSGDPATKPAADNADTAAPTDTAAQSQPAPAGAQHPPAAPATPTESVATEPKPSPAPASPETADQAKPAVTDTAATDTAAAEQQNPPSPSDAKTAPQQPTTVADEEAQPKDVKLRFNFRFQPWGEVLDWLAEQADLSLQSNLVPEGTFNYSDNREYTPTEAIDLINGVLLQQGYTLVRRGRLLTVLSLEDEVPDVLVEFVPVEQLDERGEFELVKTIFHLAKMEPSDAEQEIGQLLGPGRSMVVMPKARQIMVTETAGKLRTIRDVIERAENPTGAKDKGVTEYPLQFVSPEEVLLVARPLLGLGTGENVGEEINIAQDTTGTRLFATGSKDKMQILEDIIERLDKQAQRVAHRLGGIGTAATDDPSNPDGRSLRGPGGAPDAARRFA